MVYGETPKFILKLADLIEKKLLLVELYTILISILGLVLFLLKIDNEGIILNISIIFLSLSYFILSLRNYDNKYDKFINRLMYYSYSIALIGILFVILNFPGGITIHSVAVLSMSITLLCIYILGWLLKKLTVIEFTQIFRTLVILTLLLVLFLTPQFKELKKITKSKYENVINK